MWFVERTGFDWYRMNAELKIGTPMVRAEVEFRSAVTPRDTLSIEVSVQKIGRSSAVFRVLGRIQESGACCWDGSFTSVFIDTATRSGVPIPPEFRVALEQAAAPPS